MAIREWLLDMARSVIDGTTVGKVLQVFDGRMENRMTELGMLSQAFQFVSVNDVRGDYFEFGLWRGKTFRYAHRMKRRYRKTDMILWGFDSFRGLPPVPAEQDNIWTEGDYTCSEAEVRRLLKRSGLRDQEYVLVSGFYKDSLNGALHQRLAGRKAAIVYIDCDLYESAIQALEFMHRYLANGTIACFDDFYCYKSAPDQGEQRALAEFLAAHLDVQFLPYLDYSAVGKSFIVRRVPPESRGSS